MKPRCSNKKTTALTLIEVLVIILVLGVFFLMIDFGPSGNAKRKALKINCINNLKQVGLAYRLWAGDHGDKYPMDVSVTNGGTMELSNGKNAWINFLVMSNELTTPKLLYCPADVDGFSATNSWVGFNNQRINYFVGLNADTNHTQAFLAGDDNFEIGGVTVKSGLLELSTNAPVAWTAARHKFAGNILLADGSVQQCSNSGLTNLFHQTGLATNRLAIP
jgi:prepilin-type processing-associated H-X9-DG protein